MKHFKIISTSFVIVIAVIFGCNVFYLVSLYNSIRSSVERDVMTALADADLDELWVRAERAQVATDAEPDNTQKYKDDRPHGETAYIKIPMEIWWRPHVISMVRWKLRDMR